MTTAPLSIKKPHTGSLILLPLLPVIFFFLHAINQYGKLVISVDMLILFFVYAGLTLVIYTGSRFILKSKGRQSLFISTLSITCFLFYGIIQDYLLKFTSVPLLSNSFFLLVLLLFLIICAYLFLNKKEIRLVAVNRNLFLIFIALISYEIILLTFFKTPGKKQDTASAQTLAPLLKNIPESNKNLPDIYHIVFDGYTNRPALHNYWNFDNDIYDFLAAHNFYTVDSATSNYNFTPLSMASVFNMQYLEQADLLLERNAANFFSSLALYDNNELFQLLKRKGYRLSVFSHLSETKELTALGNFAPEKPVQWLRKQTLERIYLNPWIVNKFKRKIGIEEKIPAAVKKGLQHYADYNQRALKHILGEYNFKENPSPVFNFTHFLLPHEPYVFDEKGKVTIEIKPPGEDKTNYLLQIKYANTLIRQITGYLLSDTTRKKIIIIQGDHGYRSYVHELVVKEYETLSAFYFPDTNYAGLKKNISLVNSYRIVLNSYFNYQLPLLKDSIILPLK